MLIHHLIWMRTGSGGYGDLGIMTSNDVTSTSGVLGSVPGSG